MKKFNYLILAALTAMSLGCSHAHDHDGLGHDHNHSHSHATHDHEHEGPDHDGEHDHDHGHEGASEKHSDEITLEPEQAERLGVEVTTIEPQSFSGVIPVTGRIMPTTGSESVVTSPTSGVVRFNRSITQGSRVGVGTQIATVSGAAVAGGDAMEAARLDLEAAKRELDRITPLHESGIVSTRDYNAALAAYESARNAAGASSTAKSSGSSATARTAGVITSLLVKEGDYVEAGAPIATVSSNERLTLRADLPLRYNSRAARVVGANIRPAYSDSVIPLSALGGKVISPSLTSADDRPGYIPVYFTLGNNGAMVAGSYADVYLILSENHQAVIVPVGAVSEQQGEHFVYVRLDEECYEKRPVTLGDTDGVSVEILKGINPGEDVVTSGMIFVKLAESSGAVPEGHSHSH